MLVHPEIAALRGNGPAQRRVQARMAAASCAWRAVPQVETIARALDAYGAGAPLEDCCALAQALCDIGHSRALILPWIAETTVALREEPLGEVPHRYRVAPGLTSIQLMRSGRATLSLLAYERPVAAPSDPETALFQDRETHEIVLSGAARGTSHTMTETGRIVTCDHRWKAGDRIRCPDDRHARQVVAAKEAMLLLQLTRLPGCPGPTREYRLADGALVHCASGDKAASQRFMALSVLGALGHPATLSTFEARAIDRDEDSEVRWEAVRQALAMDPRAGMSLLGRLRGDPADPLARPAADLEDTLAQQRRKAA